MNPWHRQRQRDDQTNPMTEDAIYPCTIWSDKAHCWHAVAAPVATIIMAPQSLLHGTGATAARALADLASQMRAGDNR